MTRVTHMSSSISWPTVHGILGYIDTDLHPHCYQFNSSSGYPNYMIYNSLTYFTYKIPGCIMQSKCLFFQGYIYMVLNMLADS